MKSKSFDFSKSPTGPHKMNKTFDFVGLYKTAAETNVKLAEKRKSFEANNKESPKHKAGTPKRERSPNKNRKRHKQEHFDISQINIDGSTLDAGPGRSSPVRVTSTPLASGKSQTQASKVKSIMKNTSVTGAHDEEAVKSDTPVTARSKKRNKSVSFMLDDHEEVVMKKTKSDDSLKVDKSSKGLKDKKKNIKKLKHQQSEKENKVSNQSLEVESGAEAPAEKKSKKIQNLKKTLGQSTLESVVFHTENTTQDKKKKLKKVKKQKSEQSAESGEVENNNNEVTQNKIKKLKKKKPQMKHVATPEARGEPAAKSQKIDGKPDIAEDLENLSIGENAHTLTNLLDEMTVVDKDKRKKLKQKFKKNKNPKAAPSSPEPGEEKSEEKEKIKWKRRKWNRDKKGDISEDVANTSVIVENLPLSIMLNYKKLLSEHFVKHGLIKKIGIAEVYPTEESKPVFTTSITFYSDGAAEQALGENNAQFEGARIRVKRPLPATQTTLVVRSYAELSDQAISSAFLGAGKIRSIRHLVKGKKTIGSVFVELDGPESVERAIKMAANAKIGGRKIHVAKFEVRDKRDKKHKGDGDSAVEADSEDSND